MLPQTFGFIGAGQMAQALARGFVAAGLIEGRQIVTADPVAGAVEALCQAVPGAQRMADNRRVVERAEVVFLAVKPQVVPSVLTQLKGHVGDDKLLISIAAGVRLRALADGLGTTRLVRVMPNTPCLVGLSASAYSLGAGATPADGELVAKLLGAVGRAFAVDEKLLDAVTGLSGSGPAYVYVMIEALTDGGVRMGLPREVAAALAAQTVKGAAEMVLTTGEHPAALKDRVASPGGTTIAGLQALEVGGVRAALMAAVEAATKRAIELGAGR
ncbi:MAG TPA: pyrroline-5-carboxylate reductase [Pirellulales bacterium]|jgi:pyrroline-5-carboxylate reductase|nr:pyrroline-5-carboxylate reductase [Pirellulales bacterium]